MSKLFGIPMTNIMITLLVILGLVLLTTIYIAVRNPVIFRLGIRNVPRRKAQTGLIVVGLMLSTLIMSAAFATGDTIGTGIMFVLLALLPWRTPDPAFVVLLAITYALYLLPGLAGAIVVLGNRLRRRASSEIVKPRKAA